MKTKFTPLNTSDYENPDYLFSRISTNLLAAIASGAINPIALAERELANRGVGKKGKWVGFSMAKTEFNRK